MKIDKSIIKKSEYYNKNHVLESASSENIFSNSNSFLDVGESIDSSSMTDRFSDNILNTVAREGFKVFVGEAIPNSVMAYLPSESEILPVVSIIAKLDSNYVVDDIIINYSENIIVQDNMSYEEFLDITLSPVFSIPIIVGVLKDNLNQEVYNRLLELEDNTKGSDSDED